MNKESKVKDALGWLITLCINFTELTKEALGWLISLFINLSEILEKHRFDISLWGFLIFAVLACGTSDKPFSVLTVFFWLMTYAMGGLTVRWQSDFERGLEKY